MTMPEDFTNGVKGFERCQAHRSVTEGVTSDF